MQANIDGYSEYKYKYFNDGAHIKSYHVIRHKYDFFKDQFGFRDILLFSLRELAKEVKARGYKEFALLSFTDEDKDKITIDEYLNNFDPKKINLIYNYKTGKNEGSGIGSYLALGLNVALAVASVKTANSSNIVNNSDLFANSVDGIMSDKGIKSNKKEKKFITHKGTAIDNKNEVDSLRNNIFYNVIELAAFVTNSSEKSKHKNFKVFTIKEVEKYFKKRNPYRIKELYKTNKLYVSRGLIEE